MARQIYVIWDEKAGTLLPGSHATLTDANNAITRRQQRSRGRNEEGKQYDAIQVTIP